MDYTNFPDREDEFFLCLREVCSERDRLTEIFSPVSEVLRDPCWPLDQGQKGFFREFVCDLDAFEPFVTKLADRDQSILDACAARVFLEEFRKTYGWELKVRDNDDWHAAALARGLRRDYSEMAEDIEPMYRKSLAAGTIRIAWGLCTTDTVNVSAFVHGLIEHPAIGRREMKNMGWGMAKCPSKDDMRQALKCAINLALPKG